MACAPSNPGGGEKGQEGLSVKSNSSLSNASVRVYWLLYRILSKISQKNRMLYCWFLNREIVVSRHTQSIFFEVFVAENYRPTFPLPNHPKIVDLGGNVGFVSLYFKTISPLARIKIVEANPKIFPLLKRQLSNVSDIEFYNVAVAESGGEIPFFINKSDPINVAANAQRIMSEFPDRENYEEISVPALGVGAFLFDNVDLMKVDVEGAEYRILMDEEIQPKRIAQMIVEFHDVGLRIEEFRTVISSLAARGFSIFNDLNTHITDVETWLSKITPTKRQAIILKLCALTNFH